MDTTCSQLIGQIISGPRAPAGAPMQPARPVGSPSTSDLIGQIVGDPRR